jgi:hypothetical protein
MFGKFPIFSWLSNLDANSVHTLVESILMEPNNEDTRSLSDLVMRRTHAGNPLYVTMIMETILREGDDWL